MWDNFRLAFISIRVLTDICFAEYSHQHAQQEYIEWPQPQGEENDQDYAAQVRYEEAESAPRLPAPPSTSAERGGAPRSGDCPAADTAGQDSVQDRSDAAAAAATTTTTPTTTSATAG